MKNIAKKILVLTAVVLLAACGLHGNPDRILENAGVGGSGSSGGGGTGGNLTVTNIPSGNSWDFIHFDNESSWGRIIGASSVWGSQTSPSITGVSISGRTSVSLPMWTWNSSSQTWQRFSGSQSVFGTVSIRTSSSSTGGSTVNNWSVSPNFIGGNASVTLPTVTGGTLSVSGIPSGNIGNFIHFDNNITPRIIGAANVSGTSTSPTITGVSIPGTSVSLPMWTWNSLSQTWQRFSGSQTVSGTLRIASTSTAFSGWLTISNVSSTWFSSGNASVSWGTTPSPGF